MSKKTNTLIFILAATIFNVLVTAVSFIILLVIYSKFFFTLIPENMSPWVMPVIFIVSTIISILMYRLAIKVLMKKVNVEKHFGPMFSSRTKH